MLTMTNPIRRASVLLSLAALAFAVGCAPTEESTSDSDPAQTTSSLADCTPEQLDLYKEGTLTVGTDDPAFEPWFKGDDPTNAKGYESAVAYAIADRLGFSDEEVTDYTWDGLRSVTWTLAESSVQSEQVGTYTLTPTDSGTHIKLDLEIGVKIPMPGFVLKRVLKGALDTGSKGFKNYVESR